MKFRIALYPSDEGFAVCVPSLPGCWSQGATEEEALSNLEDAIREYLEAEIEPAEGTEIREIGVAFDDSLNGQPMSPIVRAELERRVALADADPSRGISWDVVRAAAKAR